MSSDGENRCLDARRVQTPSESYELLIVVRSHLFLMQLIKHFFFFFFKRTEANMRKDIHAREYEQDEKMAFFRAPPLLRTRRSENLK